MKKLNMTMSTVMNMAMVAKRELADDPSSVSYEGNEAAPLNHSFITSYLS